MNINCIIIEDEPLALARTKNFADRLPNLNVVESFDNALDALTFLKSNKIDLIFLDINMDELSGIQFLETAKFKGEVIITTAYEQYALKGYELNITDYLLKPFTIERFYQAIDKVENNLKKDSVSNEPKYIFVKTEYRLQKLFLDEIIYIEGMRDYRRIHTKDTKIMTLQTFKEFEEQISSSVICRVHKSFMVAINKIDSVERDRIRIKDLYIPISETYKKQFFDLINSTKN
jgi:two-component system LytT family response regulator